mmetsp:Transcript_32403/g.67019  ORF Transcript_32403/g.67019 Transcript_32403/m.67019 type:complete len:236 (+) Transcript_32403:1534-2241(+)
MWYVLGVCETSGAVFSSGGYIIRPRGLEVFAERTLCLAELLDNTVPLAPVGWANDADGRRDCLSRSFSSASGDLVRFDVGGGSLGPENVLLREDASLRTPPPPAGDARMTFGRSCLDSTPGDSKALFLDILSLRGRVPTPGGVRSTPRARWISSPGESGGGDGSSVVVFLPSSLGSGKRDRILWCLSRSSLIFSSSALSIFDSGSSSPDEVPVGFDGGGRGRRWRSGYDVIVLLS